MPRRAKRPSEQELPDSAGMLGGKLQQTCLAHAHRCAQPLTLTYFPVAVSLQGYAGATHWKVYIIARGVQPLVICDATTLSVL